jgi:hypothetical protein
MIVLMHVYIKRDSKGNIVDEMNKEDALVGMTLEEQGGTEKEKVEN